MNDHAPIHATPAPTAAADGAVPATCRARRCWGRRLRRAVLVACVAMASLLTSRSATVHAFGDLKVDIGGVSPSVPNSCLSCAAVPPTLPDPFHPDDKIIAGAQTLIPLVLPANRSSAQNPEDAFIVTVRNTDVNVTNPPSEPVVFEYRAPQGVTITGMQMNGINASGPIINLPCEIGTELDPPEPSTCEIGQLPPAVGAVTIQIEYYVDRAVLRETLLDHDVRAYLTPIGTDANEADNQDHAFTSVETLADLSVLKSGPSCPFPFFPNNMKAGTCDIFKLAVKNNGPSVARHVFVGDSFLLDPRGGLTIEEARVVETEGTSCSVQTTFGENTGMLCDLGDIITGDVRYVEVKVCASSDIPDGKNFLNFTAVGSGSLPPPLGINPLIPAGIVPILGLEFPFTPEPCLSLTGALKCLNNVSVLPITVNSEADLDIEKSVEPSKVNAGEQNKYTIKVTNNGPSDVLNPIVKDTLPQGVDYEVDDDTCLVRDRNAAGPDKYGYFTEDSGRDPFLRRDGPQEGHDIDNGDPPPLPLPYDVSDPGAPFFDISTTGTAIGAFAGGPDDGSASVPIGFDFTFYDEVVNSVWVSTNGYLKFGTGGPDTTDPNNDCPLTESTPNRAIYAFWDDLDVSTGSVRYRVVTNPQDTSLDVFIVQWNDATVKSSGDQISFQVQLFQGTNQVRIVYGPGVDASAAAGGASATVGIEPRMELADAGGGVTFGCGDDANPSAPFLDENQVIAFTPDLPAGDELICRVGERVKPGSVPAYIDGAFTGYPNMGCIAGLLDLSLPFDNFQVTNDKIFAFRDGSTVTHVMKPGEMRTIEVQGLVDPSIKPGTLITNTAVITGYTTLGDPTTMTMPDNFYPFGGNNTGDTKNLVLQKADLRVTKFGKPDSAVRAGEVLTYTIVVDNYGPSWADDVAIKDVLQASKNFDLIDIHSDRRAVCNGLPGPRNELIRPSKWPLDEPPPAFGVDNDTGVEDIKQRLELDCTLVDDPDTPEGDEMASENTMENRLEVLAADGPPNSGRWIVTLRVRARDTQSINNVVDVLSPVAADPDRANNHDEVEHEITDVADLEISKTDSGDPFVAGTEFEYYIDVHNDGPSVAQNVVVVDTLPLEVSVVSISQPGAGSCATVQGTDGNLRVQCNLGNIGADEDERITIRVKADPDIPDGTILFNQAVVTSDIFDPTNHDNITRARSVIIARVDLGVTKVDDPDPVLAGQVLEYRITAVNKGPSNARDVVVRDALPADVTFVSANVVSGPGVCLPAPMGYVTCQLGKLGVGQVVEIAVKVRVNEDAPCGTDIVNDVTIESTTDEVSPDPTANADQRRTRVNCDAVLAITKTVSDQTPVAGSEYRYTIAVTNNGPSRALDVRVTDDLPSDVVYRLDTFGCGASLFGAGCALGDLAVGQTVRFDVIVALEADATCGTTLTNVASVDADNAARVDAAADIVVDCASDLWIRKFGKPDDTVQAGEELTYYVAVTNLGPSDTVPGEVFFRDLLASDGSFTVTRIASDHAATCDPDNGPAFPLPFNGAIQGNQDLEIVCTLADDLNPNAQWMVEIDVTADQAQTLNNTADVFHARSLDPNRANDHAEVAHAITDVADLSIVKSDSDDPVTAGTSFDYNLNIVNHGPSPAENVVVRDTLPLGLRVTGLSSPVGGSCGLDQPADGAASVVCRLGDLDPNEQHNITIEVEVPDSFEDGSTLWNAATVDSDVLDPERGDNLDRTRTRVVAEADLEVQKVDDPDPVVAGERLTYRVSVVNHGPSRARNVVVTDDVPDGFRVTSAAVLTGDGVCQALPAGFVTCDLGSLPAGAGHQIVVEGVVDPALACGTALVNTVRAGSDTAEPAPDVSPSTASQTTTVDCRAVLRASKTASTRTPAAGTEFAYTLSVHNAGPSVAADVVVKDILPPSMTYVLDTRGCGVDLLGVGCDLGDLAPGQTVTFDVVVRLAPDAGCRTVLTNTMLVTSATASSVVARADVAVACDADLRVLKFGKPDNMVRAGEILSYTVVVDNLGPSFAEGVFIKDIMQSSGTFTVLNITSDRDAACVTDPAGWADITGHLEIGCTLDDPLGVLDENGSFPNPGRWIVSMTVMANEAQSINNVVDAAARLAHDPDRGNNRAVVEHAITDVADLSITKTDYDAGEPFSAGTTFTYDITVKNDGPSAADNVVVVDTLPIGLDIVDLADGCAATTLPTGARKVTCNLGTLDPGAEPVITLEVRVAPDVADGTVLWNRAIVYSDVFDPDNRDNIAQTPSRIGAVADLEVTKVDDPDPVTAGAQLQYQIRVTNHGPSLARDVVLTDDMPAGVTVVSVVPLGGHGTCQPLPIGHATCHFDTLAPGASETVVVVAEVSPAAACGVDLVNVVSAASASAEPQADPHPNTASAVTSVVCRGRLVAAKVASTYTPVAGGDLVYTLSVRNLGPSVARSVTVTDTLPAGMTYVFDTRGCGADLFGAGCALGDLAPGDAVAFDVVVHVAPDAACGAVVTNVARFTSATADPVTVAADTRVDCAADLRVLKFGKPDGAARAGEVLTYTVVVDNLGPSYAPGVAIKDVLRASGGFDVLSISSDRDHTCLADPVATGGGGPLDPWLPNAIGAVNIDCTLDEPLGVLRADGFPNPGRWTLTMTVRAREGQSINNVADATSAAADPDASNNRARVEHAVTDVADLEIAKTDSGGPFRAGTAFEYRIAVANRGPSTAENVVVVDTLPLGLSVVDIAEPVPGSCSAVQEVTENVVVTCNLGTLADGDERDITITVRSAPNVADGTVFWNQAIVVSDMFDPDNQDNVSRVRSTIVGEADLGVTKSDTPDPVTAGQTVEYRIVVTNYGPSTARDVVVSDDLPDGVAAVSAVTLSGRGICQAQPAGFVTCHFDGLAPDGSEEIVVTGMVDPAASCATSLVNRVTVSSTTAEPAVDPHGNSAATTTDVACRAELELSKVAATYAPVAGGDLIYALTVRNRGPSVARAVVLDDTLPAGMSYVLDSHGCGPNLVGAGCALGDMAPGAVIRVEVLVRIAADVTCGTVLRNVAEARSTTAAPVSDVADTLIKCESDLRVVKIAKPDGDVSAGKVLEYTITVDNLGPSVAPGVAIHDLLQSSGTFDVLSVASNRPATCGSLPDADGGDPFAPTGGAVTGVDRRYQLDCTLDEPLGVLAADGPPDTGRWILTVTVTADASQDLNNVASVQTGQATDPDASNNQSPVVQRRFVDVANLSISKTDLPDCDPGDAWPGNFCDMMGNGDTVATRARARHPTWW
ncbi:MAG: DUF11 domain-containing protein [Chloroflexi bacterium CFX6]|nr:DUF11 domain-containing protein [Chloroflexi bacterium CFX6]